MMIFSRCLIRLTFLLLLAAVVEVDVLGGELQATGHHVHHRHQLAVLPQHQLLLLARLLCFNPAGDREDEWTVTKPLYTVVLGSVFVMGDVTVMWCLCMMTD